MPAWKMRTSIMVFSDRSPLAIAAGGDARALMVGQMAHPPRRAGASTCDPRQRASQLVVERQGS
jgi:hypothetical protein